VLWRTDKKRFLLIALARHRRRRRQLSISAHFQAESTDSWTHDKVPKPVRDHCRSEARVSRPVTNRTARSRRGCRSMSRTVLGPVRFLIISYVVTKCPAPRTVGLHAGRQGRQIEGWNSPWPSGDRRWRRRYAKCCPFASPTGPRSCVRGRRAEPAEILGRDRLGPVRSRSSGSSAWSCFRHHAQAERCRRVLRLSVPHPRHIDGAVEA